MVVQMRVDVGRGAEVAMPQPFLNLLHGNAFRQQQACATVPEIVQADDPHVVLLQQSPETVGQRVGLEPFSQFIDADVSDGKIAEAGTHDELLAKGGKYAAMWNAEQKLSA